MKPFTDLHIHFLGYEQKITLVLFNNKCIIFKFRKINFYNPVSIDPFVPLFSYLDFLFYYPSFQTLNYMKPLNVGTKFFIKQNCDNKRIFISFYGIIITDEPKFKKNIYLT